MIFEGVRRILGGDKNSAGRQLSASHLKRFYDKIHWTHPPIINCSNLTKMCP